ncbi:MAG: hypothetical protein RBQ97_10250 [Acholeplasma sp.]|nr:hypothetical protein [Acholeplasma sp.]
MIKEKLLKLNIYFLWGLAVLDLIRGVLHTFFLNWSNATFAQMGANNDALMMLGAFGISNILTGSLFILILMKNKNQAPYVLALISVAYVLGSIGLKVSQIQGESSFYGRYMMIAYLGLSMILSFAYFAVSIHEKNKINKDA